MTDEEHYTHSATCDCSDCVRYWANRKGYHSACRKQLAGEDYCNCCIDHPAHSPRDLEKIADLEARLAQAVEALSFGRTLATAVRAVFGMYHVLSEDGYMINRNREEIGMDGIKLLAEALHEYDTSPSVRESLRSPDLSRVAEDPCVHASPSEPKHYPPCPKCGYCSPNVSRVAEATQRVVEASMDHWKDGTHRCSVCVQECAALAAARKEVGQ